MVSIELVLIAVFGLLNAALVVIFGRMNSKTTIQGLQTLDGRVGEAITTLVNDAMESLPMNSEPPNPMLQIFADYMKNQLNPTIQVKDITRDDSGKFQSDNI